MTSLSTDVTILKGSSGNREYTAHWRWETTLTMTLVIERPLATVTKAPEAITGLEYTGSAQELVTAGTAHGGTMVYALGNDKYSVSIPTGTDEGHIGSGTKHRETLIILIQSLKALMLL